MRELQKAVAACLQERSGVKTVCGRSRVRGEYPLLAVSVRAEGTTLLDGGRQAQHRYRVTVTAASDRDREENTALLAALPPLLLRGVPAVREGVGRTLHPLDIQTEGESLSFALELCVPVPPETERGQTGAELMKTLHLGL